MNDRFGEAAVQGSRSILKAAGVVRVTLQRSLSALSGHSDEVQRMSGSSQAILLYLVLLMLTQASSMQSIARISNCPISDAYYAPNNRCSD
jgi:hypothetical protein